MNVTKTNNFNQLLIDFYDIAITDPILLELGAIYYRCYTEEARERTMARAYEYLAHKLERMNK